MTHGGTVNPPWNRKVKAGNPSRTGARASALPDSDRKVMWECQEAYSGVPGGPRGEPRVAP